ncbi:DEAD/DEAH box helicase family protein [Clostridioides sp. ES-S-0190-01]|nr:DEAD/DEAH box helicase family protein [Clostridioides sp. ES-S-0190-01]
MKYELFDFQKTAVNTLLKRLESMQRSYESDGSLSAVPLIAPTGSGKTVIAAAVAEALFYGNDIYSGDSSATILWLSDSPSLNEQTLKKFADATDLLSDAKTMEVIGPDFAKNHLKLQQGHIYFLNRQLLGEGKKLSNPSEVGRTFYDVLTNTIEDDNIRFYLFIDEAHRGLGSKGDSKATSENTSKTIYAKLIDGQEGNNPPVPVVIGISATPENFNKAMNGRKERDIKAEVKVPVSQVRTSGLVKDSIELRTPQKAVDTKHQDLKYACEKLAESSSLWKKYCEENHIYPIIVPLMVVQVEDKVSKETLAALCSQICKTLPWLDSSTCFANVFGGHEDIITNAGKIPYVKPEDVAEHNEIKVLFAKDAVSTGWDCPRAEVIYSRRKRSDPTYIAQLIGRMVRTPLARRIRDIEELNTVSCYLPQYDASTVESVVKKLKEDNIDQTSNITVNSVDVAFFGKTKKMLEEKLENKQKKESGQNDISLCNEDTIVQHVSNATEISNIVSSGMLDISNLEDEFYVNMDDDFSVNSDEAQEFMQKLNEILERIPKVDSEAIRTCFESIITRQVRHDKPNHFLDLWDCVDIIEADLNPNGNLDADIQEDFYRNIEAEIKRNPAQYKRSLGEIRSTQMSIKRVDPLTGEEFEDRVELAENDADRLLAYYKNTVRVFSGASDKIKYCINKRMKDELDTEEDAIRMMCAVGYCIEIVQAMEVWAESKTEELLDIYGPFRASVSEKNREKWDRIEGNTKPYVEDYLNIKSTNTHQNKDYDRYEKHIISDDDGWSYHKLNELEQKILRTEMSHALNVAWYRNQPKNLRASLSIPKWMNSEGKQLDNCYPDFIFFQNVGGKIIPSIVDPHGGWLGDSVGRLKGYVSYLKDHPTMFARVLAVTDEKNDEIRYLDLMKSEVQEAIDKFTGSHAKELFNGPLSKQYKIVDED